MPSLSTPCKKRSARSCKRAKKSCTYVNKTRKYCRKRKNSVSPTLKRIYKQKTNFKGINPMGRNVKVNYGTVFPDAAASPIVGMQENPMKRRRTKKSSSSSFKMQENPMFTRRRRP